MDLIINGGQPIKNLRITHTIGELEWLDPAHCELPESSRQVDGHNLLKNIENCDTNAYGALKVLACALHDSAGLPKGYCSWLAIHRGQGNYAYSLKLPEIIGQIVAKMCEHEVFYGTQKEN